MTAPETIWIDWSPADERHAPTAALAYLPHAKTRASWVATEYRRSDIPATDAQALANPKVRALVEAVKAAFDCGMIPKSTAKNGGAARHARQVHVADAFRDAIAAMEKDRA